MKRHAPSTDRNREPILAVLRRVLPSQGTVLEVASGTGQHARWFAPELPNLRWQPTERSLEHLASIAAWREDAGTPNLLEAIHLDVHQSPWPFGHVDAVICINMIHITPWSATEALMKGASSVLSAGSPLVLYGPFMLDGAHTAESNADFDADLRSRNAAWGIRDLGRVAEVAAPMHLLLDERVSMPANNFTVVFRKSE